MKIKNVFSKFVSALSVIALLVFLVGPQFANAASLTAVSDTMSREMIGVQSTHKIVFKSTSAIGVGTAGITLSIPWGTATTFTGGTFVSGDIAGICHGPSTGLENGYSANCTANNETLSTSPGANQWGFTTSGANPVLIVLAAPTTTFTHTIAANDIVTIFLASTAHMVNPASAATPTISITTTSDTGAFTVPIIASDQITVSASVNETVSFSVLANTTNTGTNYTLPLGTLSSAAVSGSGSGGVYSIWANLSTNAGGGAVVTVQSANGDLKSASTSDNIPSATATMANGTANYGVCIVSVTQTSGATLTKGGSFPSTTCTHTPAGNTVSAVTTSAQSLLTASAGINTGIAEIAVDAENSVTTPAHSDYGDTLTFIATGTF